MKKVLIIDDTKNIRLLLSKCLELEGYDVISVPDGKKGLELIENQSFDLVFLDIKLPEVSGTEVLRRMRSRGIKTPVIVITAYPTIKNAVECTRMGSIFYLQKPFTTERLLAVLKDLEAPATSADSSLSVELIEQSLQSGNGKEAVSLIEALYGNSIADYRAFELLSKAYDLESDKYKAEVFSKVAEMLRTLS